MRFLFDESESLLKLENLSFEEEFLVGDEDFFCSRQSSTIVSVEDTEVKVPQKVLKKLIIFDGACYFE